MLANSSQSCVRFPSAFSASYTRYQAVVVRFGGRPHTRRTLLDSATFPAVGHVLLYIYTGRTDTMEQFAGKDAAAREEDFNLFCFVPFPPSIHWPRTSNLAGEEGIVIAAVTHTRPVTSGVPHKKPFLFLSFLFVSLSLLCRLLKRSEHTTAHGVGLAANIIFCSPCRVEQRATSSIYE